MVEKIKFEKYVEISIAPTRTVRASAVTVPISQLKLDQNNVRFAHLGKVFTDEEMQQAIVDEEDTKNLCAEIDYSKGLTDPLIIVENKVPNFFIVKEGCRRLVCCRQLVKKYANDLKERKKFEYIHCLLIPNDTPERDIALYLARVHVSGKKRWRALNKAAHMYELHYTYGMTYDDIKSALSMGKSTIARMIKAYRIHTEYGKLYASVDKKWLEKYSYFDEFLRRKDLLQWSKSDEWISKLMIWLKNGKLSRGDQIRELSKILSDRDGIDVLDSKNGTFQKALETVALKNPVIGSDFYNLMDKAQTAIFRVPREEMISTANNDTKYQMLKKLEKNLHDLILEIERLRRTMKRK